METLLLFITMSVGFSFLIIILLYLAVLRSGAQSIIADRDTRHSNSLDEYKGVQ